ncbi:beta-lactamase/transpeptidase-like protein [Corynespora cassiicola Philippines]|uniref:Beta-lactamase/transpeptidase-like protein n=1 Tax=Corynespora cassiicola Philippines TaxID=1448308 RepID=A0A2T2P9Y7_CORCC|nr:beta-lactamase/transpeptidase-like protein [Corynespora cassiicola Philippines]
MESFEQSATSSRVLRLCQKNVTVAAISKDGSFNYMKRFDDKSNNDEKSEPVYWIASMTKFLTSIAALQCVERGQLHLDEDISAVLPEFKDSRILVTYDAARNLEYRPASCTITLRHLLTHTAGVAYFNPKLYGLPKMRVNEGKATLHGGVFDSFIKDLVANLGTSLNTRLVLTSPERWYVKRVNPGHTLGSYFERYLFQPLGIKEATFHLEQQESFRSLEPISIDFVIADPIQEDFGGGGLYTTCSELLKLYGAILREDERILKKETIRQMITPQSEGNGKDGVPRGLDKQYNIDSCHQRAIMNTIPRGTPVNFGLGSLIPMVDVEGRRSKESITWSGFTNCYWWIDMEKGVAGIYLSQLLPHGDLKTIDFMTEFESAVYKQLG